MKKKLTWKGVWGLVKDAFTGFMDDKVVKLSGALAYFTVFSIGPMLIVIIFFADLFWGREAVEGTIFGQIKGLVGATTAAQIQEIIRSASLSGKGPVTGIIGIITLLIGATTVFAEIQDTINTIWGLKPKPEKGWLKIVVDRLLSFSIVVSIGFLLLVSLVVTGLVEALSNRLIHIFPDIALLLIYIFNLLITFGIVTLLFAIIFKVLPDAKIKWKDVITGAMVTAGLFMLGKFGITFYIGSSNVSTAYGTAGSFVILMLWVYYSSIILYFGAEFTKAYAATYGGLIKPNQYAVWVKQIEVEDETGSLKYQEQKKKEENEETGDNIKVK
ncbi:YihY/virulence factor BrkB family protein [Segetibacter aerophilus]|uniref:Serum resistance protein BrkB n=1 Tax=Segetibacter aerophilus TaxID=670293 RepID=A0A512B8P7_9BACT|nr:YihY/virulence factor BrkB family protein [Segetibacter aerophilus]GEO08197.1 serum resistance protein BrkB [Segetibacter aerophilus]